MRIGFTAASALVLGLGMASANAEAANTCSVITAGSTMTLQGDCTTDVTLLIPDGMTLDGAGYTITAVDPAGGSFNGAIVRNAGATASVVNLNLTTSGLRSVCKPAAPVDTRLRGILFDGASGRIWNNRILDINKGASGCQEGNGIEVRNLGRPDAQAVVIEHNDVLAYQKTGIAVLGNVSAEIRHNNVGASATQARLAANSVQVGPVAHAVVEYNRIAGNSWHTASAAATAVLLFQAAPGTSVSQNHIMEGNADVGIYVFADGVTVENNRVFESGADGVYDFGIGNWGSGNRVHNNKIRGFEVPVDGDSTRTRAIPSPHEG